MKYNIEQTKELIDFLLKGYGVFKQAYEDQKIDFTDVIYFVGLAPKIMPAFSGIQDIPNELKDLDQAEQKELIDFIIENLAVDSTKAKLIVEKSLYVLASGYDLFKVIKQ
jgi:hypothetical protein